MINIPFFKKRAKTDHERFQKVLNFFRSKQISFEWEVSVHMPPYLLWSLALQTFWLTKQAERRIAWHEWSWIFPPYEYKIASLQILEQVKKLSLPSEIFDDYANFLHETDFMKSSDNTSWEYFWDVNRFWIRKQKTITLMIDYVEYLERERAIKWRKKSWAAVATLFWLWLTVGAKFHENIDKHKIYTHVLEDENIPEDLDWWVVFNLADLHIHEDNTLNIDEWDALATYADKINAYIEESWLDPEKIILIIPWDIISQKSAVSTESDWEYVEKNLPLLNRFPGKYRVVTFWNHDEIHSETDKLRQWFLDNWYTVLDKPWVSWLQRVKIQMWNSLTQILWTPSYLKRKAEFTPEFLKSIIKSTKEHDYTFISCHNLDGLEWVLDKLENTSIHAWHTHWLHLDRPILRIFIRKFLKYHSKIYKWFHTLKNNVFVCIPPWMNNSSLMPFRSNSALPWWALVILRHKKPVSDSEQEIVSD